VPGKPGQRGEENGVNEVAPRVKAQLASRRSAPTRKSCAPLMVVEGVERSRRVLDERRPA
jgi:hypothetical protein